MPRQGTPQVHDAAHAAAAAPPQRQEQPSDQDAARASAQVQTNGQPAGETQAHPPSAMEVDQQGK